jgi:AraC-like DNA-binding protein
MDVLSDLLQHLQLTGELLANPRCFAPCGLAYAAGPDAAFHLIAGGGAILRVAGQPDAIELRAGDFVLLPGGSAHSLADVPGSPLEPVDALRSGRLPAQVEALRVGGSGRETGVVSGRYRYVRAGVHALLTELPPVVRVRAGEGWRGQCLEPGVQLLSAELASPRPGSAHIVARLLDVLFLQAVRCCIEDGLATQGGWLRGLRDERIASALGCIHGDPQRGWSTAALAEQAGMARGAFAARFVELMGETPPHYLTRWRIQTALLRLREGVLPLGAVATAVGYPSQAAFTRIFKRMVGMPPAEYRRAVAAGREPLLESVRSPAAGRPIYAARRFQRG